MRAERNAKIIGLTLFPAALLADDQYKNGLINFSTMLDSQRAQLAFEAQLVQSQSAITQNLIQLYKALGGGWQPME
ncbi:MAG: hypothetical protein WCH86_00025 [Kiritimatiellales bacterium]